MALTPTARTLAELRKRGLLADITEHWVPRAVKRKDLLGFIDIVCVGEGCILGIQCTSRQNVPHRVKKIKYECREAAAAWLSSGGRVEVWGWAKRAKPLNRKWWHVRIVEITEGDLNG